MIGILAEKPSQARNFAKALGGQKGVYNGEQYLIVPARGHLYGFLPNPNEMVAPALVEKYKSWGIENLPWNETDINWKYGMKEDAQSALDTIKSQLGMCDEIVIGTDDDPTGEGTLLAWEIISELNLQANTYSRMFFADESEKEVQKAFTNRKVLGHALSCMYDDPDYKQALFRTKWDYLSIQWTRVAASFSPRGQMPRQGRLKSAMVKIVGDQLELVKNYVKKPFYQARFIDENKVIYTNKDEPTFDKKEDVPIQNFHSSSVVCDKKEIKYTAPPKFLDLATLGGILAPKGVPAKTVLTTYQKLYEAKIVSYPRTEDKCITIEQFNELLPLVDKIASLVGVDASLMTHRQPRKTHVKTGMAHGANRPGSVVPSSLDTLDAQYGVGAKMIYVTLAKNYLATLCEDYEFEKQTGHVQDYPKFIGTANVPKSLGWKQVFGADVTDDEDDETSVGLGTNADPYVYEGANPKPTAPTMKWLMKQLEKHDVGTGATRTSTYADVTNAKSKNPLLIEKKGKLSMAPVGETSYILLPGTHIGSLDLTEKVMAQMKEIYDGKTTGDEYLHEIQQMVVDDIEVMRANSKNITATGVAVPVREKYTGNWNGKDVTFAKEWSGHTFTDAECEALCRGESVKITAVSAKTGKEFTCEGKLEIQTYKGKKFVGFKVDPESMSSADGADRYTGEWNGKKVAFKREWAGHHFTDEECEALCRGETISVKGKTKDGKDFECQGSLEIQDYKGRKFVGFKMKENAGTTTDERWVGTWNGKKIAFKRDWSGHHFTDDECEALCRGEVINITATSSKTGKDFNVSGKLEIQDFKGRKYVGFKADFGANTSSKKGIPESFCQHKFTDDEMVLLEMGKEVFIKGFVSKAGKAFDAYISYGKNKDGRMGFIFNFDRK